MSARLKPLPVLRGHQARAASPRIHASLSASAGTGKTQVLTARVLRLLLAGVPAESILCITFTKAGAAEMAERIHERLAYWVRLKEPDLRKELFALGIEQPDALLDKARTLFVQVLDAPGGLRIQTIHSFAQSLLAAFPAEAGLVPGFRPLEGREEQQLARATLAEMLVRAEGEGDLGLVVDLQFLSLRLGEGGAERFMMACARAGEALEGFGSRQAIDPILRRLFDVPDGPIEDALAQACCDDVFDLETLRRITDANRAWGTATGLSACDAVAAWLTGDPAARGADLQPIASLVLTQKGELKKASAKLIAAEPDYEELAARLAECCGNLLSMKARATYVQDLAAGLRAGQAFARAYREAKRNAGAVDFDDLINGAERLLAQPGMGDWVRYKLDRQTDHILVDEAQDTNARQWSIVGRLVEEYFAGKGARGRHRTLFTVGDYKQAIFSFQGTNPGEFEQARAHFAGLADAARVTAQDADMPADEWPSEFVPLSMDRSFRSAPQILEAVDGVIAELGYETLGLPEAPNPHEPHHDSRAGSVTLWKAFSDEAEAEEESEEGWVSETVRAYASRVAKQIRTWIDDPFWLECEGRPLRPQDILILVRKRSDLAGLLVARLYAENVPVAGVDRLLLSAPLAVQDLLAAARFAVQPLDDLNLASLLVSPLFGWSQDDLYPAAFGREGSLWPRLRALSEGGGQVAATVEQLLGILRMADFETPYAFFETLLSGPLDGRRKLIKRLGAEARDPVEELLTSALEFESKAAPGLQGFLDWFARGEVEIVRDPSSSPDAVRVMTVHGSKGLQAPVVILADACVNPERGKRQDAVTVPLGQMGPLPLIRPRKGEVPERLADVLAAQDEAAMQEHWRLLYVALTRAEERLYVGGALGPADRGVAAQKSWYAAVEAALGGLGAGWQEDGSWTAALTHGPEPVRRATRARPGRPELAAPAWLRQQAPVEERPSRPLAPSAPGPDDVALPPPGPAMQRAARRGQLLHRLFERLPDIDPAERRERGLAWLARAAGVEDEAEREALVDDACTIIGDPRFGAVFAPGALAEAPLAAVVGGETVAGTVDRLLIDETRVLVVDFKTGTLVPDQAADVPATHLRQMAAYAAALRVIFPDRHVEAALLYTAGPRLVVLDQGLLAAHAPG